MSTGLSRVGSYTVIDMSPRQKPEEQEESPSSITDEKIGRLCVICLTNKISEEMQTIPHKKNKENDLNGKKNCVAHEEPSLCRTCFIQLDPKICPLCRDEFSLPEENPIPAQPLAITQNQQVIINIQAQPNSRYHCTWVRIAKLSVVLALSAFTIWALGRGFGTCTDQPSCPENETWKGWW